MVFTAFWMLCGAIATMLDSKPITVSKWIIAVVLGPIALILVVFQRDDKNPK